MRSRHSDVAADPFDGRPDTSGNSSTGYASANMPCVHDVAPTGLYHFKVQLFTNLVSFPAIEAAFIGIRFP